MYFPPNSRLESDSGSVWPDEVFDPRKDYNSRHQVVFSNNNLESRAVSDEQGHASGLKKAWLN